MLQGNCYNYVIACFPGQEELFHSDRGGVRCFYQPAQIGRFVCVGSRFLGLNTLMS